MKIIQKDYDDFEKLFSSLEKIQKIFEKKYESNSCLKQKSKNLIQD